MSGTGEVAGRKGIRVARQKGVKLRLRRRGEVTVGDPGGDLVAQKRATAGKEPMDGLLVSEVAALIRRPCRQCKKTSWRVDVLWPDPNSEGARRSQGSAPT
jgi:hypothetical protein